MQLVSPTGATARRSSHLVKYDSRAEVVGKLYRTVTLGFLANLQVEYFTLRRPGILFDECRTRKSRSL